MVRTPREDLVSLCSASRWADRDREAWGRGCSPKGWKRPEVLLFTPELPPYSDGLSGLVRCHLEAFSFSHFIIQCYPGSLAGEGEQKERETHIIGEASSDEIVVRKFCNPGAPTSGSAARRLRAPLINSQSVSCPTLGFSGP